MKYKLSRPCTYHKYCAGFGRYNLVRARSIPKLSMVPSTYLSTYVPPQQFAVSEEKTGHESSNPSAAGAGGGGWGQWWGRGRGSRERLVTEAVDLTFRLVMSGDIALTALRAHPRLVAALRRVADGGGQRLQYDTKVG